MERKEFTPLSEKTRAYTPTPRKEANSTIRSLKKQNLPNVHTRSAFLTDLDIGNKSPTPAKRIRLTERKIEPRSMTAQFKRRLRDLSPNIVENIIKKQKQKDEIYSQYRAVGRPVFRKRDKSPESVFSKAWSRKNISPLPLISHTSGTRLVLNRYQLKPEIWEAFGKSLSYMTNITTLVLDNNGIKDSGAAHIIRGIAENNLIENFFYTRNEIGPQFVQELYNWTLQTGADCKELNLRGWKVNPSCIDNLILTIWNFPNQVEKIILGEIGLGDNHVQNIIQMWKKTRMTTLDLSWNVITQRGNSEIFSYLSHNYYIQQFYYQHNRLQGLSAEIAKFIFKSDSIAHLDISHWGISDKDIWRLAKAASYSVSLQSLHITGNQYSASTPHKLKEVLPNLEFGTEWTSESAASVAVPVRNPTPPKPRQSKTCYNLKLRNESGEQLLYHQDSVIDIHTKRTPGIILSRVIDPDFPSEWHLSSQWWIWEGWNPFIFQIPMMSLAYVAGTSILTSREKLSQFAIKGSFNNWKPITTAGQAECQILLPPGKHYFWIVDDSSVYVSNQHETTTVNGFQINQVVVSPCDKHVFTTGPKRSRIRMFRKQKSVFRDFNEDSNRLITRMAAADNKYSKIGRVIKKQGELEEVFEYLKEHYVKIKDVFQYYSSMSNYPSIGWTDFVDMCEECFMNDKILDRKQIDIVFKAVNFEIVQLEDNPDRDLCRYEFFEILVRMAIIKYSRMQLTPKEALDKLLNEHLYKFAGKSEASQFRHKHVYTVEINDVLKTNMTQLRRLFVQMKSGRGAFIEHEVISTFLLKKYPKVARIEMNKAFSFSKQSIQDEMEKADLHLQMVFVEFLEFLVRFVSIAYTDHSPLHMKLWKLLDTLFREFKLRRNDVAEINPEDESSDSDKELY